MDQFWKQFAVLGTDSKHNVFLKARLKLTALYVLIVAIIIFGFSVFLFQSIGRSLKDATNDDFADLQSHYHFIENTLPDVKNDLILADVVILLVTAGFSFVLAGKTLKPIQQSVEAQKAFTENASHEFRTPLAVIKNDIEVYLRETSPSREFTQNTMKSNLEEINRMSGIVEDLLLLARLDNKIVSKKEKVDVISLVKKTVSRMKPIADNKNINLSCETPDRLMINGTQDSLERVVLNILQNAIDHTPNKGFIIVKVEKEGSSVVLRITDTGSGIIGDNLPHIFKRFYKGNFSEGTGLGLSIVKGIVDQHHGHVFVESVFGEGTTVIVKLPLV